mmetsp:Transcript_30503/g.78321  ORF Transcript_30503/g.78321 Transcript_30503/m.78321 type:complete len:277 (+) Transcript_30503:456-1286(+)
MGGRRRICVHVLYRRGDLASRLPALDGRGRGVRPGRRHRSHLGVHRLGSNHGVSAGAVPAARHRGGLHVHQVPQVGNHRPGARARGLQARQPAAPVARHAVQRAQLHPVHHRHRLHALHPRVGHHVLPVGGDLCVLWVAGEHTCGHRGRQGGAGPADDRHAGRPVRGHLCGCGLVHRYCLQASHPQGARGLWVKPLRLGVARAAALHVARHRAAADGRGAAADVRDLRGRGAAAEPQGIEWQHRMGFQWCRPSEFQRHCCGVDRVQERALFGGMNK